ncbi:Kinesin motor domain-containing protein [Hirschfeldia incana]|nr:Kinesin motor domain-containing protein [Hirschfeldia incana]
MKGSEPVRVAVNIRPPVTTSEGSTDCIRVTPDEPQVHIGSHTFMYDFVFGNSGLPSSEIYHRCVAHLVEDLFKGYNATVLAYGQTASGKTYTMGTNCGTNGGGIIPKVMEDVFTRVDAVNSQIRVSFLEIYNEEIYDLLASKPLRTPIIIRETASGEITLQGVTEVEVKTKEEMSSYLARGSSTRATGSTKMNIQSSRSHAIFTISLQITTAEEVLCAKLRLVDLAGSERANRTGADGIRLKEGRHINTSLLALGNVIKILGDERQRKKGVHIPYRVSKLTRLLQDSLGGNSKTVMIACVSPAIADVEETLHTLRYANCARNIKNKAVVQKQKPSAPCFDQEAIVKELTQSKSEAKSKADIQNHQPSTTSVDYDAMFNELTPSKQESFPVYDKPVYDKEDVFQAFSELKIPWTSQGARFDDLFASTSSPSELKKPVYDKPVYDEDVSEAITELQYNEDVFEANHEIQYHEDVSEAISKELQIPSTSVLRKPVYDKPVYDEFEAITALQYNEDVFDANHEIQYDEDVSEAICDELQIPSTSQPDDVSSSSPSELRKHNSPSLDVSPEKTGSEQEDECQTKPVEIIDLIDDEAEVQEKCVIDLTTDEEAEVEENPFIDLTTSESQELKELKKRLEEMEAEIRESYEEKVQLEREKRRKLQREIEGLRQKLASRSSAIPSCTCSKRSSCKTVRCQCIVANRFCVPSCGCSSIKCSNRSREERHL